jgi:hypothetical protein
MWQTEATDAARITKWREGENPIEHLGDENAEAEKTTVAAPKAAPKAKAKGKEMAAENVAAPTAEVDGAVGNDGSSPGKVPRVKTLTDIASTKALAQKNKFHAVMGRAQILTVSIAEDLAWSWARTDEVRGLLEQHMAPLLGVSPELKTLLVRDFKDVKDLFGEPQMLVHFGELEGLGGTIERLKATHDKILKAHTTWSRKF